MDKSYHFISGLPRSGSTLLSSILNQNPRFYSSITDNVLELTIDTIKKFDEVGVRKLISHDCKINVIKSIFDGYYSSVNGEVCFNTNRAWTGQIEILKEIFPKSKILVCVRDINSILNSLEIISKKNIFSVNRLRKFNLNESVYSHVYNWMNITDGLVGLPYSLLKQAFVSSNSSMMMIIEYDEFCKNPNGYMKSIYNFIEEDYFEHDFDNIKTLPEWKEYDCEIGVDGLHSVKNKISKSKSDWVLPPDILAEFENYEVWRSEYNE